MALTRPILSSVGSFDATQAYTFVFSVIGGDRVIGNLLTIRNQATGASVYTNSIDSTDYAHTVPAGTLRNGITYTAYVNTKNEAGEISPDSNVIQFNCYAAATLTFSNLPTGNIIPSTEYEFEVTYNQAEGDSVGNYIFNLYDVQGVLMATSNVQYITSASSPPTTLKYKFSGFSDNSRYLIECIANSVSGQQVTTGRVEITVVYEEPIITGGITVSPNCQDGYMQGYIDWRQVPAGIDKLRIKRRRANEFNWMTIKEFDSRERTLSMIEKPQTDAGIDKFYAIDDEGVAVVSPIGLVGRNIARTNDGGNVWNIGASLPNGTPDQIVGDYIANKFNGAVGGYYNTDGTNPISLPKAVPSGLSVVADGAFGVRGYAVMVPNSSDGIYWNGSEWLPHNHFPKISHPCLYSWKRPYGGGAHILCHDYDTKKLYYISYVDMVENNVEWTEMTWGIDSMSGDRPTLTDVFSFNGYVHAYDVNSRQVYFLQAGYWEKSISIPDSIGDVTGITSTFAVTFESSKVICFIITDSAGCYIVDGNGKIVYSNVSLGATGRTVNYPTLDSKYISVEGNDGNIYLITFVADRYTGRVFGFGKNQTTQEFNWSNAVSIDNIANITLTTNSLGNDVFAISTTIDGHIITIGTIYGHNSLSLSRDKVFTSFYYPSSYSGTVNTQNPLVVNVPVSSSTNYRTFFIGGGVFANISNGQLFKTSSLLRLEPITSKDNDGAIENIAGTNADNVLMSTARDYINIKYDKHDTTMFYGGGAWDKLATTGTSGGTDIAHVVMSQDNSNVISFEINDIMAYDAVALPKWSGAKTYTYDGNIHTPQYTVDTNLVSVSGDLSASAVGDYYAVFSLKDKGSYRWANGGNDDIVLEWMITKATVSYPKIQTTSFKYSGNTITPELVYDDTLSTVSGDTSAVNAGKYHVTFTLNEPAKYQWNTTLNSAPVSLEWAITAVSLVIPVVEQTSFEYTGSVITPSIRNLDSNLINVGGTTSATDVGNYNITFSLKDKTNYRWSDISTTDKVANWQITTVKVDIPSIQQRYVVYNGTTITPIITYDDSMVSLSGTTSAINAGTYTITASLINPSDSQWSDGTTADKSLSWTITKARIDVQAQYMSAYRSIVVEVTLPDVIKNTGTTLWNIVSNPSTGITTTLYNTTEVSTGVFNLEYVVNFTTASMGRVEFVVNYTGTDANIEKTSYRTVNI